MNDSKYPIDADQIIDALTQSAMLPQEIAAYLRNVYQLRFDGEDLAATLDLLVEDGRIRHHAGTGLYRVVRCVGKSSVNTVGCMDMRAF